MAGVKKVIDEAMVLIQKIKPEEISVSNDNTRIDYAKLEKHPLFVEGIAILKNNKISSEVLRLEGYIAGVLLLGRYL